MPRKGKGSKPTKGQKDLEKKFSYWVSFYE